MRNQQADIGDPSPGPRQGLEHVFPGACVLEDAPLGSQLLQAAADGVGQLAFPACPFCHPILALRNRKGSGNLAIIQLM